MSQPPPPGPPPSKSTYWEKAARTRWGAYITNIERQALTRADSLANAPTVALDLGCEGGRWSQLLATKGWELICADIAQGPVRLCRNRLPSACCVLVDPRGTTIACGSGTIGLICCMEVPNVITAHWFTGEAARVLKEGGLVVGTFFNLWSLRGLAAHVISARRHSLVYYQQPYLRWRRELKRRGFTMIQEVGCCWFPFGRQSNSRWIPLLTRVEKMFGLRKIFAISPWVVFIARKVA